MMNEIIYTCICGILFWFLAYAVLFLWEAYYEEEEI